MIKALTPRTKVEIEGPVHYSESFQAWNVLKLKKELFSEFPQLKEKRSKFSYKLTYCRDSKELDKEINSNEDGTVFILRIFKEN
jgi:hypothetical protein